MLKWALVNASCVGVIVCIITFILEKGKLKLNDQLANHFIMDTNFTVFICMSIKSLHCNLDWMINLGFNMPYQQWRWINWKQIFDKHRCLNIHFSKCLQNFKTCPHGFASVLFVISGLKLKVTCYNYHIEFFGQNDVEFS